MTYARICRFLRFRYRNCQTMLLFIWKYCNFCFQTFTPLFICRICAAYDIRRAYDICTHMPRIRQAHTNSGDHWVLAPNQYHPCQRADPQRLNIVAAKISRCDYGAHHLRTDTSHLVQLVTRIVLQPVLVRWRQTTPSRFIPPLLGSTASDNPLDARQRCPIVVRTSFAKPYEDVAVKSTALLSLPMARNMKCID